MEELCHECDKQKEVERLKEFIIANFSHEIRTPITIARGMAELALNEKNLDELKEEIRIIIRSLDRLDRIIDNMLELISLEQNGYANMKWSKEDIMRLLKGAVREMEKFAKQRNVKLTAEISDNSPKIICDRFKIALAILNIIDNAIKFNNPGGEVKIKAHRRDSNIEIIVSDTGIGIPRKKIKQIIDPLTQLDPSTTRSHGGMGMGLAVADKIVRAHGGKLQIESDEGKGTTVTISLPIHSNYLAFRRDVCDTVHQKT